MDILVVGDSWAAAREEDTGLDEGWPLMMGIPKSHRQGVSGTTAAQWANNEDGMLKRARRASADVVIVSLLGNDARHAMDDGKIMPNEIATGLRDLRTVVKTVMRKVTIVMLYADPYSGGNASSRIGVPLINGVIQFACGGLPVVFAVTGQWLGPGQFNGKGIHPVKAGHRIIAENMKDLVAFNLDPAVKV